MLKPLPRPGHTLFRVAFVVAFLILSVLLLLPADDLPESSLSDKIQHVVAFMAFMFSGMFAFPRPLAVFWLAPLLIAIGGMFEILQLLVPGRQTSWGDFIANAIGVVTATLLAALWRSMRRACEQRVR